LESSATNRSDLTHEIKLTDNWKLQSSSKVGNDGKNISSTSSKPGEWLNATVPSTIMGVLTNNGLYDNVLVDMNYRTADKSVFDASWWYKTEFKLTPEQLKKNAMLEFDGISYRANIWLNGVQIASKDKTYGAFRRHKFNISPYLKEENTLAVEVFRAQSGEYNIGFVDWNPRPLDESMGIFREVRVLMEGNVGMRDTWVQSKVNIETLKQASISVQTQLTNYTSETVSGTLDGRIENIKFSIPVTLTPHQTKTIKLTENEVKGFNISNPRLWWCNNMGKPELYDLDLKFIVNNKITTEEKVTFGIRDFRSYWTTGKHQGIMLNGKKILIKSAGWTDDIFLRDTPQSNELQVQYVKDMNLNSIRFENVWGSSHNIYDLCDRYGLIAFVGFSCQWEWKGYMGIPDDKYGCIHSEHDMNLVTDYWRDQLTWLRNHPSIAVWMSGSDKIPNPTLEKRYLDIMKEIDDRIYIAAAQSVNSEISGPTGMKMLGPYEYVGPSYWFVDKKNGGGYGFNTETGPGIQIPVLESIQKMMPESKLWPISEVWDYHCTTSTTALNNMKTNNEMVEGMYGTANNLKEYMDRSHLSAYQSTKSMFEAFRVNKEEATGIVQWMLNSAWPSLYWQLYDYEKIPVPAYYGVKRANKPLQLIYNYADNGIYVVNELIKETQQLEAVIRAYDLNSNLIYQKQIPFSANTDKIEKLTEIENSAPNTYLFLHIQDKSGKILTENFYVLSSVSDEHDWEKTNWVGTPMKSYGNFKALTNIPMSTLKISVQKTADGLKLNIENTSDNIAFFTQFLVKDEKQNIVYPVFWDDNYISFIPGEKKVVECKYNNKDISSSIKSLKVTGWNLEEITLKIND